MNRIPRAALALALALPAIAPARAEDRADIDRTQIVGSRELPKVLYIVPWKQPGPGELSAHPPHSVLDEALAPLDREVFRRELHYHSAITSAPASSAAAVPGAGAAAAPLPSGDRR